MDLATILGLVLAIAVIAFTLILDGGSPGELFHHPQAILITVGGAIMAAMVSVPLKTVLGFPKLFMSSFQAQSIDPLPAIDTITDMADQARREGLLGLEERVKSLEDAFLRKGIMLVVDGVDPAQVKAVLEAEVEHMAHRHELGIGFINAMGGYAPTMGIVGTVMGLISVLKQLDDPSVLGESIAAAFLATLWGIMSANVFFLPVAGKLAYKSSQEVAFRNMLIEGIIALQAGENPRMVRDKLMTFVAPADRGEEAAQSATAGAEA